MCAEAKTQACVAHVRLCDRLVQRCQKWHTFTPSSGAWKSLVAVMSRVLYRGVASRKILLSCNANDDCSHSLLHCKMPVRHVSAASQQSLHDEIQASVIQNVNRCPHQSCAIAFGRWACRETSNLPSLCTAYYTMGAPAAPASADVTRVWTMLKMKASAPAGLRHSGGFSL